MTAPMHHVSTGQAARMLGVCNSTVRDLVKEGKLSHTRSGKHIRIPVAEVEKLTVPKGGERPPRRADNAAIILAGMLANPANVNVHWEGLANRAIDLAAHLERHAK